MAKRDNSKKHLRWLGRQWGLRIRYPKPLADALGQEWYTAKTHTADLREAHALRDRMLTELKRKAREVEKSQAPSIDQRELELIEELNRMNSEDRDAAETALLYEAEDLEETGHDGVSWYKRVTDQQTPVAMHLDRWSREVQVSGNTQLLREAAIKEFAQWARGKPLQEIERRTAGEYTSHLIDRGLQASSVRAYLSKLSAYWQWMIVKGLIEPPNIWVGQTARGKSTPREPWNPTEIRHLVQNAQSERLRDAILIAAHSGLRADEVCQLTRGDCIGGLLNVSDGKTAASKRVVPQHSAIQKLIAERMRGKQPHNYLLHEYKGGGRQLSKDFSLLRTKLFGEAEGRQATKVFHSLRHFAKTAMLRGHAGKFARELAVNELLGHAERGMNRVYFHGVDLSELREAIELIKVYDE